MPASVDVAAFITGGILLVIGILGGGVEAGSLRIPALPNVWLRALAGLLGALLIVVGIFVHQGTGAAEKTFNNPLYRGVRLDICFDFAVDCGRRPADKWCRAEQDFPGGSADFEVDPNIGARGVLTKTIGSEQTCSAPYCTGYKWIICRK